MPMISINMMQELYGELVCLIVFCCSTVGARSSLSRSVLTRVANTNERRTASKLVSISKFNYRGKRTAQHTRSLRERTSRGMPTDDAPQQYVSDIIPVAKSTEGFYAAERNFRTCGTPQQRYRSWHSVAATPPAKTGLIIRKRL